jgi:hypothetical protein
LAQFFDDFFRTFIAAGFAFAFAVVDANVKLPHLRLLSFDHENSLRTLTFGNFITEKENQCTRFYPGDFVAARAAKWLALVSSGEGNNVRSKPGSGPRESYGKYYL